MSAPAADIAVAALLLASAAAALLAALGLVRLPDFFMRMHAPALASSLAVMLVALASIVFFSSRAGTPVLYPWLVGIVLAITAPVTAMLLARAALFRGRQVGEALPPPLRRRG